MINMYSPNLFFLHFFKYMLYGKMSKCEENENVKLSLCTAEFVCAGDNVCML